MYSDVLNLSLPEETMMVGYADDIALVVVAKHLEDCNGVPEDPEHVFFHCPRFVEERRNLEETLGGVLVENWDAVNSMIASIQDKLRKAEERRKMRSRAPRIEER